MVKIQKNPMRLSSGPVIYANFDFQLPVTREYPHLAHSGHKRPNWEHPLPASSCPSLDRNEYPLLIATCQLGGQPSSNVIIGASSSLTHPQPKLNLRSSTEILTEQASPKGS